MRMTLHSLSCAGCNASFRGGTCSLPSIQAQHGSSGKVSNLINMMPLARYDYLVIADSDVRVAPDYLARVVPPLLDSEVGIVTCPYRGCPGRGTWSLLESAFINDWFMPSVYVAALLGSRAFAFGATIGLRREVLARIGGFISIADQLADDYRLGELTRRMGLRTVLSEVVVGTVVDECSLDDLVRHELRWLRTIRAVRPLGYALLLLHLRSGTGRPGNSAGRRRLAIVSHAHRHGSGATADTLQRARCPFDPAAVLGGAAHGLARTLRYGAGASSRAAYNGGTRATAVARDGSAHAIP